MRAGLRLTLMILMISEVSSKEERRAMTEGLRIAIVRAVDGHTTVCGPHDFKEPYYSNPMDAALSWHIVSGHMPAECLWVEVDLPPLPSLTVLRAKAEVGEFPKSFIELGNL